MSEAIVTVTGELVEIGARAPDAEVGSAEFRLEPLTREQMQAIAQTFGQRVTIEIRRARE